jgi:MFS family permease
MLVVAFATSKWQLLSGAVLFGLATGMGSPTATAWTIDLSLDAYRGRALATMYIALEAGIGLGALISGTLYSPGIQNFGVVFGLGAAAALLALAYLFFIVPKRMQESV